MATTTNFYDPSEDDDAVRQREAEALAKGEELAQAEEEIRKERFDSARKDAEAQQQYAGKYKSAEELEKAYLELQKKLGEKDAEPEVEEEVEEEGYEEEESADVTEVRKGLELAAAEFDENGSISEATLDQLAQLDSRTLVETWAKYVAETRNQAEQAQVSSAEVQKIYRQVGGEEAYGEMIAWASENLTAEEIGQYDAVVNGNDYNAIGFAVQALKARYEAENGSTGRRVSGRGRAPQEPGFRSHAELAAAIRDPRYRDDPAYRYDVEQKLARSGDLM